MEAGATGKTISYKGKREMLRGAATTGTQATGQKVHRSRGLVAGTQSFGRKATGTAGAGEGEGPQNSAYQRWEESAVGLQARVVPSVAVALLPLAHQMTEKVWARGLRR